MSAPQYNPAVVAEAIGLLTSAYQKKPNVRAILTALMANRQQLEDTLYAVYTGRALRSATLYDLPTTNSVLDAIGALVGEPRNGLPDADYQAVLFLAVAVNRSTGRATDWSSFAQILLQTSGGGVEYAVGDAAFWFYVGDLSLSPIVVAQVLARAVPPGVRGVFGYSTWPDGNDFEWGSVYDTGAGQGTWGSVYDGSVGGLLVAVQPLS